MLALVLVALGAIPASGGVVSGTTSGSSAYGGSCASATESSPEAVLTWTPTVSGTVTFKTCSANTGFDTVVYVRDSLDGNELACNDDTDGCATGDGSGNADHHGSVVTMEVTAGRTYYVFVDGYDGSSGGNQGPFELTVQPPATPPPSSGPTPLSYTPPPGIQDVFVIWLENADWSQVKGSSSAPYINSLLSRGAHAENYRQVVLDGACLHPSTPNYLFAEMGADPGFRDNASPSTHLETTGDHLTAYLKREGISVRNYSSSAPGTCPDQDGSNGKAVLPLQYFSDLRGAGCAERTVPLSQLSIDLDEGLTPRYTVITLDDAHSGHDRLADADNFLADNLPAILASPQYLNNGAVFIVWDEGSGSTGCANIGLIALSPLAKRGYSNTVPYSHASLLRTVQRIFGVQPYIGAAATANDFADLFQPGALH